MTRVLGPGKAVGFEICLFGFGIWYLLLNHHPRFFDLLQDLSGNVWDIRVNMESSGVKPSFSTSGREVPRKF